MARSLNYRVLYRGEVNINVRIGFSVACSVDGYVHNVGNGVVKKLIHQRRKCRWLMLPCGSSHTDCICTVVIRSDNEGIDSHVEGNDGRTVETSQ